MRTLLVWIGGILAALAVAWIVLHVVIAPVNPVQGPPPQHFSAPCWTCHIVSGSAELREVQ